ncbi:MAG: thioredoxin domain-containing protein [Polyangiaceae bacterium]
MTPSPPDLPDARRSGVSRWALVPIALGGLMLVGGAATALVFALRAKPAVVATARPSHGLSVPTAGVKPPPPLPKARTEHDEEEAEPDCEAEPEAQVELPRSPEGERVWPDEAGALLPVSKGQAIWGLATAPVTLAIFGDLQCDHTRAQLRSLSRILARRGSAVRLVFYHRPLAEHADAEAAALMLAATALQVGTDAAFRVLAAAASSNVVPSPDELGRWLSVAGVAASRESLSRDGLAVAQLESDRLLSVRLDVRATPTLFVNGRRVVGQRSDAELDHLIDDEARTMRFIEAQGVARPQAYARRLRKNLIGVGLGVDARACVPVDKVPTSGASAPLVTIVEFSDFECEACRSLEPTLSTVMSRHGAIVRRAWRSFALPQHRYAARAAAFALSARELAGARAFWDVHSALLGARGAELDDERLRVVASRLGLDADRLLILAERAERTVELSADHELAEYLGLDGAPTLFVNGRRISGAPPLEALEAVVKEEIEVARRVAKAQGGSARVEQLLCDE